MRYLKQLLISTFNAIFNCLEIKTHDEIDKNSRFL